MEYSRNLINMEKEKEFLICVDSDGCALDTMDAKHMKAFGPKMVEVWKLEDISNDVLTVWNFVNLYSKWRGINRFLGLVKVFELLRDKKSIIEKGFKLPEIDSLTDWVKKTKNLSNDALSREIENNGDLSLMVVLKWSEAVNKQISMMQFIDAPFTYLHESLEKAKKYADIVVISSANKEALHREWKEYDIEQFVKVMAGQEYGTKKDCIGYAKCGKYNDNHVLMIGDALGDLNAAKENGVLFYPIIPNEGNESWKRFCEEAIDKFINGDYEGCYEDKMLCEFRDILTSNLPWE